MARSKIVKVARDAKTGAFVYKAVPGTKSDAIRVLNQQFKDTGSVRLSAAAGKYFSVRKTLNGASG